MAITIQKQPQIYNPAGNQNIWQVTSDNENIQYFRVSIIEAGTTNVISNLDLYVAPSYPTGCFMNLTTILQNLVSWELNADESVLCASLTKPIFSYRLKIVERVYNSGNDDIEDGDTYDDSDDATFIWYAMMDRYGFDNYYGSDYIVQVENTAKFLTNKPDLVSVNDYSTEMLYFLSNGSQESLNVVINTYDSSKTLLNTYTSAISDLSTKKIFRLSISPPALKKSLDVDFTNVKYYTLSIQDSSSNDVIQQRKYLYGTINCSLQPVSILFVNNIGGIDSYQFVNPQKTINVTKSTIIQYFGTFWEVRNSHSVDKNLK